MPGRWAGQGCTQLEQTVISEELGKATGALWAVVAHPAVALKHGTPDADRDYLATELPRPSAAPASPSPSRAPARTCGSSQTRADRRGDRYVINGEKWFVTSGDNADYIIVHANVDGDPDKPTLFLVDKATPGVRVKREPKFTHTYVFGHPEFVFEDVEVGADARARAGRRGPRADARTGSSRRGCRSPPIASAPPSAPSSSPRTGPRSAGSSAARSATFRPSSSCSPTWRSRSWRPRA